MKEEYYIERDLIRVIEDGKTKYFAVNEDTADNMLNTHSSLTLGPKQPNYDIELIGQVNVQMFDV